MCMAVSVCGGTSSSMTGEGGRSSTTVSRCCNQSSIICRFISSSSSSSSSWSSLLLLSSSLSFVSVHCTSLSARPVFGVSAVTWPRAPALRPLTAVPDTNIARNDGCDTDLVIVSPPAVLPDLGVVEGRTVVVGGGRRCSAEVTCRCSIAVRARLEWPPPVTVRVAGHWPGEPCFVGRVSPFSSEPLNGWLSTESVVCRWSRSRVADSSRDHPTRRVTSPELCRGRSSMFSVVVSWTAAATTARRASDPDWIGRGTDPESAALDRESAAPLRAAVTRDGGLGLCRIPRSIRFGRRRTSLDRGVILSREPSASLDLLESCLITVLVETVGSSWSVAVSGTDWVWWTVWRGDARCVSCWDRKPVLAELINLSDVRDCQTQQLSYHHHVDVACEEFARPISGCILETIRDTHTCETLICVRLYDMIYRMVLLTMTVKGIKLTEAF